MKRTASITSDLTRQSPGKRKRTTDETSSKAANGFPRWTKGTVWIHLSEDPRHQYQLHKAVLERTSTWFLEELRKNIDHSAKIPVEAPSEGVKFQFVLEQVGDDGELVLVRTALKPKGVPPGSESLASRVLPVTHDSMRERGQQALFPANFIDLSSIGPEVPTTVKIEQKDEPNQNPQEVDVKQEPRAAEDTRKAEERRNGCIMAHKNLLRIYYNHTPEISTADIDVAFNQCEALVEVAERYGSLYVVRPYLGNIFSQYRHALFVAIWMDPPRWLNLSIPLQSAAIFSEAIIHLAGCWPQWPWRTPQSTIAPDTLQMVAAKAKALADLRNKVDRNILQNTITQNDRPVTLTSSYETWLVVQLFRDWFINQQNHFQNIKRPHYGSVYRLMRAGGDAYLPAERQLEMLLGLSGSTLGMWEEVGEDLKLLKEFAQGAVVQLCKNALMLDVEEAGVPYLTCVDIVAEDLPWMKQVGDDES